METAKTGTVFNIPYTSLAVGPNQQFLPSLTDHINELTTN